MVEVVGTFGGWGGIEQAGDGGPELVPGAGGGPAQQCLELGEQLLDRVRIRTVGRQVEERGAGRGDGLADALGLVRFEVAEHHHIAGCERRGQELLDIGAERRAGHRSVEHQRRDDAALAQAGDEGRGAPVAVRHGRDQALARRATTVTARHVGGGAGLVEEHEPRRVHEALPASPLPAFGGDVGAVLLRRPQRLFFTLRPSRPSALWIVESPATMPQRRSRAACSSASVMSGRAATNPRRSASCGASSGRRWPPKRDGATLPVVRTRCISLIAADGLTAKRRTAARIELPRSTARTSCLFVEIQLGQV
jgi:hypothetical protein